MFQRFHDVKSPQDPEIRDLSTGLIEKAPASSNLTAMINVTDGPETGESERSVTDISQSVPIKEENPTLLHTLGGEMSRHIVKDKKFTPQNLTHLPHSHSYSSAMELLSSVSACSRVFSEPNHSSSGLGMLVIPERSILPKKLKTEDSHSFVCQVCNLQFKNGTQLKNHFWKHTGSKPFKCDLCQACFTQQANLKTHQRIHTGERPFDCRYCGASFTQISNLKTHQKLHTGEKPFVCDLCNARFTQQSNLKSHRLIHTGERPFKCDMCDASFVQSTHLRNHKRIHTNERPYSCEQCGASFRQLSNLKSHEKTHTGEKPFVCIECGSSFAQKSNLKAHKLKLHQIDDEEPPTRRGRKSSHGGTGPFACKECGADFSASSNLKSHMRLHTGEKPFECSVCFASFAQKSNLKAHELTHSDEKPFACPDCPSCFKQKANLRNHIIKKHNGSTLNYSPYIHGSFASPNHLSQTLLHMSNVASGCSSSSMPRTSQRILVIEEGERADEPLVQIQETSKPEI